MEDARRGEGDFVEFRLSENGGANTDLPVNRESFKLSAL